MCAKKPIKSRFTVFLGAAMDGTKCKAVVIGKSKNPRCFKDINRDELPVHYYNSPNAWMTRKFFWDWFMDHFAPEVIQRYGKQKTLHILLDNCSAHPPADD